MMATAAAAALYHAGGGWLAPRGKRRDRSRHEHQRYHDEVAEQQPRQPHLQRHEVLAAHSLDQDRRLHKEEPDDGPKGKGDGQEVDESNHGHIAGESTFRKIISKTPKVRTIYCE